MGFRSLLNTNISENSEVTVETTRMISSEITSQMSRGLEEIKSALNSQIVEANNSAIVEKVLPSIQNTVKPENVYSNAKMDVRSDGPHQSSHTSTMGKPQLWWAKLSSETSNPSHHRLDASINSQDSDEGSDIYGCQHDRTILCCVNKEFFSILV